MKNNNNNKNQVFEIVGGTKKDVTNVEMAKKSTIDYKNDPLNGSMFIINNPNAKSTCGCGSSAAF